MLRMLAVVVGFAACALANAANFKAPIAMSEAAADAIRGRQMSVVRTRFGPLLDVYTPARELLMLPALVAALIPAPQVQSLALLSLPAVIVAKIDGYFIVTRNGIDDPRFEIADKLAAELAQAYDLTIVPGPGKGTIILVVATRDWGVRYSFDRDDYEARYRGQLVLREGRRRVYARAECRVREPVVASSYDELVADRAAALKTALAATAEACADELRPALFIPR